MNRRTFLKVTTFAGGGLLVGCKFDSPKIMSSDKAKCLYITLLQSVDKTFTENC